MYVQMCPPTHVLTHTNTFANHIEKALQRDIEWISN